MNKLIEQIFEILISKNGFICSYNLANIIAKLPYGNLHDNSVDLANLCADIYSSQKLSKFQILRVLVGVKNGELEC